MQKAESRMQKAGSTAKPKAAKRKLKQRANAKLEAEEESGACLKEEGESEAKPQAGKRRKLARGKHYAWKRRAKMGREGRRWEEKGEDGKRREERDGKRRAKNGRYKGLW